nr:phytanoyl-CoA dioxygenase family protein [Fluviicola sp.]
MYNSQLSASDALTASKKLVKNGYSILNDLYTRKEIRRIGKELHDYFTDNDEPTFGKRTLIKGIPSLKEFIFNENLKRLVKSIDPNAFLVKSIYFDKPDDSNWFVSWHQDIPINIQKKIETVGFTSWTKKKEINSVCPPEEFLHNIFTIRIHLDTTLEQNGALKVIPGSHTKRFTDDEIKTITAGAHPALMEVKEGGVQLMKPLLLHSSSKTQNQKRRRVIHLEFSSLDLPNGLEWLEREAF